MGPALRALIGPVPDAGLRRALLLVPLLFPLVMLACTVSAGWTAANPAGWHALFDDVQWPTALCSSVVVALAASSLALLLALAMLAPGADGRPAGWLRHTLPVLLAVPHAAFAIGIAALIAPTGWLLRLLAPLTGWTEPPAWPTVQDPWGLGLTAVLVLKETPFLLWAGLGQLNRPDAAARLHLEWRVACSFGHSPASAWWRVGVPQLLPRLRWPLLAVLAYSLTVVDVALVIGPGSPPTLAVLAWGWLQSPDSERLAQGAAAGAVLTLVLAALAGLALWRQRAGWPAALRRWWCAGPALAPIPLRQPRHIAPPGLALALPWVYGLVMLALALGSVIGVWRFPALWPEAWTPEAWATVSASPTVLADSVSLALASAGTSLLLSLWWLEAVPAHWDRRLRPVMLLPLVLPGVLWVVGVHRVALHLGLDTSWSGVWLAHTLVVLPYTLIALSPAYQGFDVRLWHTAATLGCGRLRFLLQVKWPLLRAALAAAFAVGMAVSVAQYLPTLYLGGGRINTVTTEAVTLASGAQRSLTAAFAWVQWLLPALGFALAAWVAQPRWREGSA